MPISRAGGLLALLFLAGCAEGVGVTRAAPERVRLADGLVIAGGNGWCIDPSVSRTGSTPAVVVLGSCAAIEKDASAPRPDVPGIVTVSVDSDAGGAPTPEELETFFVSDAGRAALAQDGRAESVDILETRTDESLFYLHSTDRSALPSASPKAWRALFGIGERFVSVSLYVLAETPVDPTEGLAALQEQVSRLIAANSR